MLGVDSCVVRTRWRAGTADAVAKLDKLGGALGKMRHRALALCFGVCVQLVELRRQQEERARLCLVTRRDARTGRPHIATSKAWRLLVGIPPPPARHG